MVRSIATKHFTLGID